MLGKFTYGTRQLNKLLDDTLMGKYKFPSQTLMEIAGIAVAQVCHSIMVKKSFNSICVLVGPGNNGGDGLVAARHLKMMSYNVSIIMFKKLQGKNNIYHKLCQLNNIPSKFIQQDFNPKDQIATKQFIKNIKSSDILIDGIFGFPFTGQIRQPYKYFLPLLSQHQEILSIDIPSGWDANEGNIHQLFTPKYLISLGLPKKFSQFYKGQHYFGGRFVPQKIAQQLQITIPQFKGDQLYIKL